MPLEENAKIVLAQDDDLADKQTEMKVDENSSEATAPLDEATPEVTVETDVSEQKVTPEISEEKENNEVKDETNEVLACLQEKMEQSISSQKELELKVIQTLKENANFQIQVRQNMQKELEDAKKKLSGDIFIPLLKEIAELYVEWQDVINELEDGVAKKKVVGIFEVLQEILEEYGCEFGTSEIDSKRRPKYSKLKNKVLTGSKEKHETVAKSHNPWIVKEPFVLYPEFVDVYVYDSSLPEEPKTDEETVNNNIHEEE